jgi:hypothetical protein
MFAFPDIQATEIAFLAQKIVSEIGVLSCIVLYSIKTQHACMRTYTDTHAIYHTLFSAFATLLPPFPATFRLSTRPMPGVLKNSEGP